MNYKNCEGNSPKLVTHISKCHIFATPKDIIPESLKSKEKSMEITGFKRPIKITGFKRQDRKYFKNLGKRTRH